MTTLRHSYSRDLFKNLEKRNFTMAFKVCFLLGLKPDDYQESIAPGWRTRYYDMLSYSSCSLCKSTKIDLTDAFITDCGHFYCTKCATGSNFAKALKSSNVDSYCHDCGDLLKITKSKSNNMMSSHALMRPSKE